MRKLLFNFLVLCCLGFITTESVTAESNGVTLTEYYDYECSHCRKMQPVIERLKAGYPNLKIEQQVTPLLNENSRFIASFALASRNQARGDEVHQLLMQSVQAPTVDSAVEIVKQLSLNPSQMTDTMNSAAIQGEIAANIQHAEQYRVQGNLYLPILVFSQADGKEQTITLTGEQPYPLLAAVVQQLSENDAR
ncbi:MAG: DsbA family protein [Gammaproteobacteria bacterium]|nr:DsbA family protein [Gammaproteobacteria bacterium]MBY0544823.1 DsbA family protein [Gammaproteobacteria bacterium]